MDLAIHPLTPDLWPAMEDLFATKGPNARCWCMYWRIGDAYRRRPPADNKADLHAIVRHGPPPGLLAFDGAQPVAWCQVTPRTAIPWLDRHTWRLKRIDEAPVWSLSCFYIRIGCRRHGITPALIAAAIDMARRAGAPALEAYPLDGSLSPSATHTGYLSTFERAGFTVVARRVPSRPIVRYDLAATGVT